LFTVQLKQVCPDLRLNEPLKTMQSKSPHFIDESQGIDLPMTIELMKAELGFEPRAL
jgi:hypothetical protein